MADRVQQIRLDTMGQRKLFGEHGTVRFRMFAFLGCTILICVTVHFAFLQHQVRRMTDEMIGSELQVGSRLMARQASSLLQNHHTVMRSIVVDDG